MINHSRLPLIGSKVVPAIVPCLETNCEATPTSKDAKTGEWSLVRMSVVHPVKVKMQVCQKKEYRCSLAEDNQFHIPSADVLLALAFTLEISLFDSSSFNRKCPHSLKGSVGPICWLVS